MASRDDFKTFSTNIPRLRGESNWSTWYVVISATLAGQDLQKYIDSNVPQPADPAKAESWRRERQVAYSLLISACEAVLSKLLNAGWKSDGNPYTLWKALEKYIPKVSEDASAALVDEFGATNASDHKTLHMALSRCHYLRERITVLCGDLPDHYWALRLLNFFKTRLPDTYKHYTSKGSTKPTWNEVTDTIYTLAQDEEQKLGLVSYQKPSFNNGAKNLLLTMYT